jgi:hypothetical protein
MPFRWKPETISLDLEGAGQRSTLAFRMPARWPPPAARALLREATRVFRSLHTVVIHERLASNTETVAFTTYRLEEPDRLRYDIRGGPSAIVIGKRRWDRRVGMGWQASPQVPIQQPTPAWTSATSNVRLLGTRGVAGRLAWLISFHEAGGPSFYTLAVDRRTGRPLELWLTTAAHFMHHRYGDFNAPFRIGPPR